MTAQRATPADLDSDSRNERFKGSFRSLFWSSIIFATLAHFAAFAFAPELTSEDFSFTSTELTAVEIPPEIEIPPPPKSIARPATPVIATTEVNEEITIAPTTFEDNPVESLPPPPSVTEEDTDISARPTFTPFTVAPEILNREEIVTAMMRNYPRLLRASGIGGIVKVFFFIDETGHVQATQVDESSGYESLDQAALELAEMYRFSPALNRDTQVPVWVSFPVEFRIIH